MKAVVFGGTAGIGRAIAQRLAARGEAVFLLGRDAASLERSAADLTARHPKQTPAAWALCDLEEPAGFASALDAADSALGGFDAVIVTAGMFATQARLEEDVEFARRLTTANFANTVAFCEHARERLLKRGGGWLTVLSSVAGDRGRKPVAIYGASKSGVSTYLEALDHKYRASNLWVLCVKPGFVKTGMTAGLKTPPFAGEPDGVARDIVAAMDGKRPLIYTPSIWRFVMLVIKYLPRSIMRRIDF
jgi:decaprenylphospho-beta-D-erythro-pentofuranosid-2-ulose 2-reductase